MPLLSVCQYAGCNRSVQAGEKYCDMHRQKGEALDARRKQMREAERLRHKGSASERGYGWTWAKARAAFLRENSYCRICSEKGIFTPAQVVDHIVPHRGDKNLFWDRGNWQALCKRCHDIKTATEDGGFGNKVRE